MSFSDDNVTTSVTVTADTQQHDRAMQDMAQRSREASDIITRAWLNNKTSSEAYHKAIAEGARRVGVSTKEMQQAIEDRLGSATRAVEKHGEAWSGLGEHVRRFATVGVIEEFARRSYVSFAQVSEGMRVIGLETGATGAQLQRLGKEFDDLRSLTGESMEKLQQSFRRFHELNTLGIEDSKRLFGELTESAVGTGRSIDSMSGLMAKLMDVTKPMGQLMLPIMQQVQDGTKSAYEGIEATFERAKALGAYSQNLAQRGMARQMMGLTPQDLETLKTTAEWWEKIKHEAAETGEAVEAVIKRHDEMGGNPLANIRATAAAWDAFKEAAGGAMHVMAPDTLRAFTEIMKSTKDEIEGIARAMKTVKDFFSQTLGGGGERGASGGGGSYLSPLNWGAAVHDWAAGGDQRRPFNAYRAWRRGGRGGGASGNAPPTTSSISPAGPHDFLGQPQNFTGGMPGAFPGASPMGIQRFGGYAAGNEPSGMMGPFANQGYYNAANRSGVGVGGGHLMGEDPAEEAMGAAQVEDRREQGSNEQENAADKMSAEQNRAASQEREQLSKFRWHKQHLTGGFPEEFPWRNMPWWAGGLSGGGRGTGAGGGGGPGGGGGGGPGGGGGGGPGGGGADVPGGGGPPGIPGMTGGVYPSGTPAHVDTGSGRRWSRHTGPAGTMMPSGEGGAAPVSGTVPGDGGGPSRDGITATGNAYLSERRKGLFAELDKDPATRAELGRLMATENSGVGGSGAREATILERMVNASLRDGKSIKQTMHSGFYGPINRGQLKADNPENSARAIAMVRGGSNLIDLRTDQGQINEHPYAAQVGDVAARKTRIQGEYFSDQDAASQRWTANERRRMGGEAGGTAVGFVGSPAAGGAAIAGQRDALPANVLAKAREVALQSGGPGVKAFMASQGYANHGEAWCGEFAASVVKSAGGTPPKNPAVASNWRNYGQRTDTPVPGDVAVRRGASTGSTGSHVTFYQGPGRQEGTFSALGGNQGRFESQYSTGRFDFYHAGGAGGQPGRSSPDTGAITTSGGMMRRAMQQRGQGGGGSRSQDDDAHFEEPFVGPRQSGPSAGAGGQPSRTAPDSGSGERGAGTGGAMRRFMQEKHGIDYGPSNLPANRTKPSDAGGGTHGALDDAAHKFRATKAEMEKPIEVKVTAHAPARKPSATGAAARRASRVSHDDQVRESRNRHQGSHGFA